MRDWGRASGFRAVALAALLVLSAPAIRALEFELAAPEEKVLVVQEVATFETRAYEPHYELPVVSGSDQASYDAIEATAAAWLEALARGDLEWLAQISLDRDDAFSTDETRRAVVRRLLEGERLLTHRIQFEDRVILRFAIHREGSETPGFTSFAAFEYRDGRWWRREIPKTRLLKAIVSDFDFDQETVIVDEGWAVNTVRPR